MTDKPTSQQPVLKIQGSDPRTMKYQKIADVHREIVEAKWKARNTAAQTGKPVPFGLTQKTLVHLEESVAFLAEELLTLAVTFESDLNAKIQAAVDHALGIVEARAEFDKMGSKVVTEPEDHPMHGNPEMTKDVPPEEKD